MKVFSKIKHVFSLIRAFFPSTLPNGRTQFDNFANSIIQLYGFPAEPSYSNMIAMMIQHVPPEKCSIPKRYFYLRMRKAIANEVAFYVMQDLKLQQRNKKQDAEVIAPQLTVEGPNDSFISNRQIR